jgi:hypothetical protein
VSLVFARWQAVVGPVVLALCIALLVSLWPWLRARRVHSRSPVAVGAARDGAGSAS